MIFLYGFLIFIFAIIFIFFVFPPVSPIPYYPSNVKDKQLIFDSLHLDKTTRVIDLGAGDGWVIFDAAEIAYKQKLKTEFIAVEINPILILVMYIRRHFHPNKQNIHIWKRDIFKMNYNFVKRTDTIYIYISPWLIDQLLKRIGKRDYHLVSYLYEVKTKKVKEMYEGIHKVFVY